MNTPRKHHYVPQFHLGRFTSDGTKSGKLYVLDLTSGKQWQASPEDAACERDFYMLEFEGVALEKFLGEIEGRAAPIIAEIIQSATIPRGYEYKHLIEFLGVMATRVPGFLNRIVESHDQVWRHINRLMVATKERYEAIVRKARGDGHEVSDVPWEEVRRFVDSDEYTIAVSQNYRMSLILKPMQSVLPLLAARKWTVVRPADGASGFICSDRPLVLCRNGPAGKHPYPLGFGLTGTSACIALSPRSALIGIFEDGRLTQQFDAKRVGVFNMWAGLQAERFIYSVEPDFAVTLNGGTVGDRDRFLEYRRTANPGRT